MRRLALTLFFVLIFQAALSFPVYNGLYKRDTSCATGCDCWDEAQITFQDQYAVPVFLFNGTFNGNCEGYMTYAESNYTYTSYYQDDIWYYFYQDEQNGYVNVTGGPFCSYGNYTITTSTSYWNNETQYWQKNLMFINDQHPQCSYHMKNITRPTQTKTLTNNTNPRIFQGVYNRSETCSCCCWDQVSITYQPWLFPNYQFNGTFSGSNCGYYYDAVANLTFYGNKNEFHKQLNDNYLMLDGAIGDYQYYYNSQNWTIFKGDNGSIIFSDNINPQCSYSMANITDYDYYNQYNYNNTYYNNYSNNDNNTYYNNYSNYNNNTYYNNNTNYNNDTNYNNYTNYNNDTDYNNYTNYNNDTDYSNYTNYYTPYYDGEYGPVQNITNPRVLNGFYNLSGLCPSQCYCWDTVNITFQYFQDYLGYAFSGNYGPLTESFFYNFSMPFDGSWETLTQELSYQFVNLTNYTIVINYYNNYSDDFYNYGKRASEIQMSYIWNPNCTFTLARSEGFYDYNSYINTTTSNNSDYDNYTNYDNNTSYTNDTQYYNNNTNDYNNYTSNDTYNNYTPVYSPYDFDGYYTRTTNCPVGCCCFNFVTVTYTQIYNYYNLFMLNGTYSGSQCPKTKSYYPMNFTYTGPQDLFWNYTTQGYAPFLEGWIGNYGSNYTFSLNITDTNDYIQIYNVDQPQCTYYLENITYYISPQVQSYYNVTNYTNYNTSSSSNYTYYNNSSSSNYTNDYTNFNNTSSNYTNYNNSPIYNYPSTDGVFDYFDGVYRINTPCNYTYGCACWNDLQLTNFDADADNDEPYFILNGTYRTGSHSQYIYRSEKLYYPYQGYYASSVTLNSENNSTVITINTGDTHYNPNTQFYYQDIQIQNDLNYNCMYNMTNLTGLNGGYDNIANSIQLQIGKLKGTLRQ